jgi:hypothetical protein
LKNGQLIYYGICRVQVKKSPIGALNPPAIGLEVYTVLIKLNR